MIDWKEVKIQDKIIYSWNEFDGKGSIIGNVCEIYSDHVIIDADGMKLWLDEENAYMFSANK